MPVPVPVPVPAPVAVSVPLAVPLSVPDGVAVLVGVPVGERLPEGVPMSIMSPHLRYPLYAAVLPKPTQNWAAPSPAAGMLTEKAVCESGTVYAEIVVHEVPPFVL